MNLDKRRGKYVWRSTENIPPLPMITSWNWKLRFDFATKRRKSCSGTLPVWHRFLQNNNVATVSEEAAVNMKNTHSTHREREIQRNKQKRVRYRYLQLFFSSSCQIAPRSNTTCFVNCPKQFVMSYAKYNPTWAAYLAMETTRQGFFHHYCQNFFFLDFLTNFLLLAKIFDSRLGHCTTHIVVLRKLTSHV